MNLLSINGLSKSFGNKKLFEDVNIGIHQGEKIGFIGRNGEGKTTFLKILAGQEKGDTGEIIKRGDLNIEYLSQNLKFNPDDTVLEQVFSGDSSNIKLVREYQKEINKEVLDNSKIIELSNKMDKEKAWDLESEAKIILTKLGIEDYSKPIGSLSGGQKRRVALASALINPADLLILDEPTNHLDNKTIEWLEDYLKDMKTTLLMVTHDRYFLNKVTSRILELENQKINSYEGNYNYYLERKAEFEEIRLGTERKKQALYKKELAWMRQGIRARGTRQKSRVERFNELKDSKLTKENEDVEINLSGQRLGKKVIEINHISKSFGDKKIIDDFTYTILRDDRIGILGDNGSGKTTLMNLIVGRLGIDQGKIEIGETVKIGYFSQETQDMKDDQRAIDYIKEGGEYIKTKDGKNLSASLMMEEFLFTSKEQYSPIEKLSGGERRRLYLLRVLMEGPNVLILDEPTNDLDINTLQVLENYIEDFNGPVIVVSHDRYLLDRIVNKVLFIEDTKVKEYPGNYSFFTSQKESEVKEEQTKARQKKDQAPKEKKKIKFGYNEQREWEVIHEEIANLESKISDIDKKIEVNSTDYSKLEELIKEKEDLEDTLTKKMERWVYLAEIVEELSR